MIERRSCSTSFPPWPSEHDHRIGGTRRQLHGDRKLICSAATTGRNGSRLYGSRRIWNLRSSQPSCHYLLNSGPRKIPTISANLTRGQSWKLIEYRISIACLLFKRRIDRASHMGDKNLSTSAFEAVDRTEMPSIRVFQLFDSKHGLQLTA